jgi:hypothetical protein
MTVMVETASDRGPDAGLDARQEPVRLIDTRPVP